MDAEQLQSLTRAAKRRPIWEPGPSSLTVSIGRPEIERMLQHRPPFLFVDSIDAVDLEAGAIRGSRWIDPADSLFTGHFPQEPLYPGVLQIETMGQLGLCLLHMTAAGSSTVGPDARPVPVRALKIHHALFVREVLPGDQLTVLAQTVEGDDYTATCSGQILRGDDVCSFAVMEVYFVQ